MPTLSLGSQGDLVLILQEYLYQAGHYDGSIDGYFNLQTYDATRAFQQRVGIFPRGIVDPTTWKAIINHYYY
ncbi:peptidoglycan-binding domain-containing protein [Aphanothece hegewaldii]|nr:peptidoglycan-binding domain-containing protein [Aphanothece hegewaldii]